MLDNRTGKTYVVPITQNTINALSFKDITTHSEIEGLRVYDPAYQNTAVAKSAITFIDGDEGILR